MARIFVSHAAKDEELVEDLVDLLHVGLGIHPEDIFCSSLPGMGIPTGTAFVDYIKSNVAAPDLVLLVISPEFLKSQFCNNEVGATWALSLPIHPLLVPPTGYADVRGVLAGIQVGKLNDKENLNDLRDDLTEKLGIKPLRTSHWERKRDRFLAKLSGILSVTDSGATDVAPASAHPVVSSTGAWLKLGNHFFETKKFEWRGSSIVHIEIETRDAQDEAILRRLRPDPQGFRRGPIPFAYQNEGGFVRVGDVTSVSHGDGNLWSIELSVEERQSGYPMDVTHNFGGKQYTPDDLAELKAGRLLINKPPPSRHRSKGHTEDFLESLICGSGNSALETGECVIRRIVKQHTDDIQTALRAARLEAVFILKAANVVGTVLELVLGPINGDELQVLFRGVRPERNQYEQPETISVIGICHLES